MIPDSSCPSLEVLRAFAVGQLADDELERVCRHLENCDHCRTLLEQPLDVGDELLALLQACESAGGYEEEAECEQALSEVLRAQGIDTTAVSNAIAVLRPSRHYRLLAKLGAGGMGVVFQVLHTRLQRVMALKVLLPERVKQPEAVTRFDREIRLVGQLDHPNIVRPTDGGEENGIHFLIMEYVDGVDLSTLLDQKGPLPIADACEIGRQAAIGLEHAHQRKIVHRDVKPSNLMVDRCGTVKILDFGVAHLRAEIDDQLTTAHHVMGTLDYMAPEQADDAHEVDHRVDIYGLGATLYKLLCGQTPLAADGRQSVLQKLRALATDDIRPIRQRRAEVPEGLAVVLERLLARNPDDRYSTAAQVADALAVWTAGNDLPRLVSQVRRGSGGAETIESKACETYCERLSFLTAPDDGLAGWNSFHPGPMNSALPTGDGSAQAAESERIIAVPAADRRKPRRPRIGPFVGLILSIAAVAVALLGITIYLRGRYGELAIDIQPDRAKIVLDARLPPTPAAVPSWFPAPPTAAHMWELGPQPTADGILPQPARLAGVRHWQVRFVPLADPAADNLDRKIRSVSWSPDGQFLAVAGGGGDLRLVSRDGRVLHRQLGAHTQHVRPLAWSAGGRLATTGLDQVVRLWDCQLHPVRVLGGHDGYTLSASWNPLTGRLASGDSTGKIRVWDAEGRLLKVLDSEGWVWGLAWSPDGKWLAAQAKVQVRLWDADLAPGPTLQADGETVGLAWSPDGSRLAVACMFAQTAQIWTKDWQLEQILSGHTGEVWAVAWSRDGAMLATAGLDGTVRTWTADGRPLRLLTKTAARSLSVSFAPDGLLAACSYDGRVMTWDSATGRPVWVLAMLEDGQTATYTAAGQLIAGDAEAVEKSLRYVVQPEDGDERTMKPSEFYTQIPQVSVGNVTAAETPRPAPAQSKVVWTIGRDGEPLPGIVPRSAQLAGIPRWQVQFPKPSEAVIDGGCHGVRCVRWAPDGQLLAVGDGSGRVYLFSPSGQWVRTVKSHLDGINRLAWSADGQRLASTSKDGTVRLWTRELRPVCLIRNSQGPTLGAAWDPATKRLATSDSEGRIRIWDVDGRPLGQLQGNAWLWGLAWSPDGKWLVSDDGVWDAELKPGPPLAHDGEVVDLAWSPDGRLLAAAYRDTNKVRLWNAEFEPGPVLAGHEGEVWGLAWSHDGQRVASASDDRSARIWGTDGQRLHELRSHADRVWSLSFAPDGTLVSGSYDRTAIAWDSRTGEPKWVIAVLKDGQTATFTAAGQLIDGNLSAVEDELMYVIEAEDGQLEVLKPGEFFERVPESRLAVGPHA